MFSVCLNYIDITENYDNLKLCQLAKFVLNRHCKFKSGYASINFVTTEKICQLNKDFRNKNVPTDVLSFECDGIDDNFLLNDNIDSFELGDIFICDNVAKKNTINLNTSIESELKLLVVHGMLHLCGYDHIDEKEAVIMENLEEEILDAWNK